MGRSVGAGEAKDERGSGIGSGFIGRGHGSLVVGRGHSDSLGVRIRSLSIHASWGRLEMNPGGSQIDPGGLGNVGLIPSRTAGPAPGITTSRGIDGETNGGHSGGRGDDQC